MALLRRITLIAISVATLTVGVVVPATSSFAASIPAPYLTSPANNPDVAVKNLVLKWHSVPGANLYQVQLSRNRDFTNNTIQLPADALGQSDGKTIATTYEVPLSLPHATYYWRVRAHSNGRWGPYSQPWRFLREWESLISVVQAPSSGNPTLSWAPVRGASEYNVIFSDADDGGGPVDPADLLDPDSGDSCLTNNTSFTEVTGGDFGTTAGSSQHCAIIPLVKGHHYYWGVAAFDGTEADQLTPPGVVSGCGTQLPECDASYTLGGPFVYQPAASSAETLTGLTTVWHTSTATENACDADTPCPTTPTFKWNAVTGDDPLYLVRIYLDRDATTIYREFSTSYPELTPPDQYQDAQPGKPYYWQVQSAICGGPGIQCTQPTGISQNCPPVSAGAKTPPAISGLSVGTTATQTMQGGTTSTVTLTGTNILSGACVTATGGVITSAPVVANGALSFGYYAPVLGGSETFKIENPDGSLSGDSPALSVSSSANTKAISAISSFGKQSGPVALASPRNGARVHGRTVTFTWKDYLTSGSRGTYDPENYHLQVAHDNKFNNLVIDNAALDLTQYTPSSRVFPNGHYFWRVAGIDQSKNQLSWSRTRSLTINGIGPSVRFGSPEGIGVGQPIKIRFSDLVKHVTSHTLQVVPSGRSKSHAIAGRISSGLSPRQYVFSPKHPLAVGGTYVLNVSRRLVDANGNHVVVTHKPLHVKESASNHSKGWTYSHGWSRHRASSTFSGSYVSASAGHSARIHVAGDLLQVTGCKGPGMGSITFSVAGKRHTLSEHQSFTRCGITLWQTALPPGIHTLRVSVRSATGNFDSVIASTDGSAQSTESGP